MMRKFMSIVESLSTPENPSDLDEVYVSASLDRALTSKPMDERFKMVDAEGKELDSPDTLKTRASCQSLINWLTMQLRSEGEVTEETMRWKTDVYKLPFSFIDLKTDKTTMTWHPRPTKRLG